MSVVRTISGGLKVVPAMEVLTDVFTVHALEHEGASWMSFSKISRVDNPLVEDTQGAILKLLRITEEILRCHCHVFLAYFLIFRSE